jgi:surface antigen
MEDMKLFKVITVLTSLILLTNCTASGVQKVSVTPQEIDGALAKLPYPTMLGEGQLWSAPGMIWNGVQYMRFNLNKSEKQQHQQAVYHSLNNAQMGEVTAWHSKKRLAMGKIRVVHQFPTSDGHCRVYQSYIQLNGAKRHMTNKACKRLTLPWVFLK